MSFCRVIQDVGVARLATGLGLPPKNVRRWVDNDSIPAEWFAPISRLGLMVNGEELSVEYLAGVAEQRRLARAGLGTAGADNVCS
jgi:hypothetical protein